SPPLLAPASRAPLIRVLPRGRPPTSGPLGVLRPKASHSCAARTLPTGIVIGRKRSQDLRFRRVVSNSDTSIPSVRDRWVRTLRGSSYTGHEVDALAPRADEGRGRLRKAPGSREQTSIRRCPNGETRLEKSSSPLVESNMPGGGKPAN